MTSRFSLKLQWNNFDCSLLCVYCCWLSVGKNATTNLDYLPHSTVTWIRKSGMWSCVSSVPALQECSLRQIYWPEALMCSKCPSLLTMTFLRIEKTTSTGLLQLWKLAIAASIKALSLLCLARHIITVGVVTGGRLFNECNWVRQLQMLQLSQNAFVQTCLSFIFIDAVGLFFAISGMLVFLAESVVLVLPSISSLLKTRGRLMILKPSTLRPSKRCLWM